MENKWKELLIDVLKVQLAQKKIILEDVIASIENVEYDVIRKRLIIISKKDYIFSIIKPFVRELKDYIEKETIKPISEISINDQLLPVHLVFKQEKKEVDVPKSSSKEIQKIKMMFFKDQDKEEIKQKVSSLTKEKIITEKTMEKFQNNLESGSSTLPLLFYSEQLGNYETIILEKDILTYPNDLRIALVFCWTIIALLIWIPIGLWKRRKYKKIRRKVQKMSKNDYIPYNEEARKIVQLFK